MDGVNELRDRIAAGHLTTTRELRDALNKIPLDSKAEIILHPIVAECLEIVRELHARMRAASPKPSSDGREYVQAVSFAIRTIIEPLAQAGLLGILPPPEITTRPYPSPGMTPLAPMGPPPPTMTDLIGKPYYPYQPYAKGLGVAHFPGPDYAGIPAHDPEGESEGPWYWYPHSNPSGQDIAEWAYQGDRP